MITTSRGHFLADERGIVFVEFLMAFVPLWTVAVSAFQLSLISAANLVTKHAADSAARSASVVLADDPGEYGGESKRTVDRPASALDQGQSRLETIRLAALVPLLPFSSRGGAFGSQPSLERAIPSTRALGAALIRRPFGVDVTFSGVEGGQISGSEATVRVTYAFECLVPMARRLLCDSRDNLERKKGLPPATLQMIRELHSGSFRLLSHQATLLIHDAPYEYDPRGS